jgi:hypothetical protein
MVTDRFIDLDETGRLWMPGWRCMNCGHVVDHVTERNRKMQAQGLGVVNLPQTKGVADLTLAAMTDKESQAAWNTTC